MKIHVDLFAGDELRAVFPTLDPDPVIVAAAKPLLEDGMKEMLLQVVRDTPIHAFRVWEVATLLNLLSSLPIISMQVESLYEPRRAGMLYRFTLTVQPIEKQAAQEGPSEPASTSLSVQRRRNLRSR